MSEQPIDNKSARLRPLIYVIAAISLYAIIHYFFMPEPFLTERGLIVFMEFTGFTVLVGAIIFSETINIGISLKREADPESAKGNRVAEQQHRVGWNIFFMILGFVVVSTILMCITYRRFGTGPGPTGTGSVGSHNSNADHGAISSDNHP